MWCSKLSMWRFWTVCYFFNTYIKVTICLRVVGLTVPALKQRGESATLVCDYDLEGGRLYSVKWYRDTEEFYRYMPRLRPPQHAHQLDGVRVDLEKSTARRVHLRELTLKSRGLYRCEVSEEAPSFHSAQAEAYMEVYFFPRESPRITGHERAYDLQDQLDVNCSSAKSFPAPDLQWVIDGQKVTDRSWLIAYGAKPASQGLLVSTLGLRAPAKTRMKLRCVASIGSHRRERTVVLGRKSWDLACAGLLSYSCRKTPKPGPWRARAGWGPAGNCHFDYVASPTLATLISSNKRRSLGEA